MNSKLIQSASSLFLAFIALPCLFIPDEIAKTFIITQDAYVPLFIQLSGGFGFGFAVTNWMSRTVAMGGIYGKAISMGNLSQFLVGAMALLKWNFRNGFPSGILVAILIGYIVFLVVYLLLFFSTPKMAGNK